jgi:hypothetical protein
MLSPGPAGDDWVEQALALFERMTHEQKRRFAAEIVAGKPKTGGVNMQVDFHPLANIFPLLHSERFDALVDNIRENGLIDPITLHEGKIVDGRNRYRACQAAGVEPRFVQMEWTGLVAEFVWSRHQRRQETAAERRLSAGKYAIAREGEAKQRQGARTDLTSSQICNEVDYGRSVENAAEKFDVSERTVSSAIKVLKEGAPELIAAVERDEVAVSAAADIATLPREDQAAIVEAGPVVVQEAAKRIRVAKSASADPSVPRPGETAKEWAKRIAVEVEAAKAKPKSVKQQTREEAEEIAAREAAEKATAKASPEDRTRSFLTRAEDARRGAEVDDLAGLEFTAEMKAAGEGVI